jgi:hypothetical protein
MSLLLLFGGVGTSSITKTDAETGVAVDDGESIAAALTDADTASSLDAETLAAALSDADTGLGVDGGEDIIDTPASDVSLDDTDTAFAVDTELVSKPTLVFSPPLTAHEIPREDIDPVQRRRNANGNKLARYFVAPRQAINLWILENGTITEDQPFDEAYERRQGEYLGGHSYVITDDEALALIAAGYTVESV